MQIRIAIFNSTLENTTYNLEKCISAEFKRWTNARPAVINTVSVERGIQTGGPDSFSFYSVHISAHVTMKGQLGD